MKILLAMAIGGLIGYFTNWLAIKMLFRPFEAKYFLGLRLPFTPGLIPKERERIARSIGQTVEDYLLSPEAIMNSLKKTDFKNDMLGFIDDRLLEISEEDYRLEDIFLELAPDRREELRTRLKDQALKLSLEGLGELRLDRILLDYLDQELNRPETIGKIEKLIINNYKTSINSPETRQRMKRRLESLLDRLSRDRRSLAEVLPPELKEGLGTYIDENYRFLAFKLRELLKSQPIKARIQANIRKLMEKNLTGLLASLIPLDLVAEKGYQILEDYLEGDESSGELKKLMEELVDSFLATSLEELSQDYLEDLDLDRLTKHIIQGLNSELMDYEIRELVLGILNKLDRDYIGERLAQKTRAILEMEDFKIGLEGLIDSLITRLGELRITRIISGLEIDSSLIYGLGETVFRKYLKDGFGDFIAGLKLAEIVETTILEFDNEFTEKLILDIAQKELRAITILGGILGMTIGLLNPLIQSLV